MRRLLPAVLIALASLIINGGHAWSDEVNWNYGPTTHSLTLADGDYVEVTVQGISNVMFINRGTTMSSASYGYPVKLTLLEVYGHYSNKREPYVITGQVIPGSGPENGWFRVNSLDIFVYHRCDGNLPWENYQSAGALPVWKPEQIGELKVTGSGGYLGECPPHLELAKLRFQGRDNERVVREIYIDLKGGRPLPSVPPDDPGDPDYEFSPDYAGRESGPPGGNWPPPDDGGPPYDDSADDSLGLSGERADEGPGACSRFGLPVYRVDASDLSLAITDRMFAYNSLGPDLSFTHSHRSHKAADGMLGSRWFFSYEQKVVPLFPARATGRGLDLDTWFDLDPTPPAALVHLGNGRPAKFAYTSTNSLGEKIYAPEDPFLKAELVLLPDAWELRRQKPRLTHRFELVPTLITYPVGRLTSIADPFGNQMSFTYESNADGSERSFWLIRGITDAAGRITSLSYTDGLCTRITMPNGLSASYSYDADACLTETVDLLGNVTTYTYDPSLLSLTRMESAGKLVQFAYDAQRRLTQLIDPQGQTHTYAKPADDQTAFTSAAGYMVTTTLNADRLPISQSNALGQTAVMSYAGKRPTEVIKTGNRQIALSYDAAGNRIGYRNPLNQTTTRTFDAKNRLVSITNPLDQDLLFSYGAEDQLLSVTRPSGGIISYEYDTRGLLVAVTNEIGSVTRYEYDAHGNLSRSLSPTGGETTYHYDPFGLYLTRIVNPNGHATTYAYDANGRITHVQFTDSTAQTFHYDCCALTGITDGYGRLHFIARDEKLYVTDFASAGSASTSITYDGDGRQSGVSSSSGRSASVEFDDLGRPAALITPAGTFLLSYDEMWNITAITNPAGHSWGYGYNDARQLIAETDPLGRNVTYTRDGLGRTTAITNADGSVVGQSYTVDGEPHILTVGTGDLYRNEYNAAGWVTAQHTPQGTTALHYDAAGRVTRLDYPGGLSVEKSYDANGNLATLVYPDGTTAGYQHDLRERLTQVTWNGGAVGLGYDAGSRLTAINRANQANTVLQRNQDGLVTALTHSSLAGQLARLELTRDGLGRITRSAIASDLLPPPDFNGEPPTVFSSDSADGLADFGGSAAHSDLNGNITAIAALGTSYSYDALNRVRTITTAEGITSLAYDGLNRVIRIQSPQQTVRFFYDERSRLLFATDDADQLLWINFYAGQMLLAQQGPTLGLRYYHYSELGHTLLLTDSSGGVVDAFSYTPFGVSTQAFQTEREWFTLSGSFAVLDLGRGHYHMRHRLYHASLGRFLQRDPIGMAGGANLYAYTGSDPVNTIDPFGLSGWMYEEMDILREEYTNRKEIDKSERNAKVLQRKMDLERREEEKWIRDNPVKAWAAEQLAKKALAFATGGLSEVADAYDKYQKGQYVDIVLDRFLGRYPGLDETKSLLQNLERSYGDNQPNRNTLPGGGGSQRDWNDLGGGGGPQCLMEYGEW